MTTVYIATYHPKDTLWPAIYVTDNKTQYQVREYSANGIYIVRAMFPKAHNTIARELAFSMAEHLCK